MISIKSAFLHEKSLGDKMKSAYKLGQGIINVMVDPPKDALDAINRGSQGLRTLKDIFTGDDLEVRNIEDNESSAIKDAAIEYTLEDIRNQAQQGMLNDELETMGLTPMDLIDSSNVEAQKYLHGRLSKNIPAIVGAISKSMNAKVDPSKLENLVNQVAIKENEIDDLIGKLRGVVQSNRTGQSESFDRGKVTNMIRNKRIINEDLTTQHIDSLDDQVDRLLMKYEQDSIVNPESEEDLSMESISFKNAAKFLFEAPPMDPDNEELPEPDPDAEPEPSQEDVLAGEDEEEEKKTTGSEEINIGDAGEEMVPKIDIDNFTSRVSRLISGFDVLLDPRTIIANRAMNYLRDKYDDATADEFEEILSQQYGIELGMKDPPRERPMAAGAGPGGF